MIVSGRQLGLGLQVQVSIPRYEGGAANVNFPTCISEELTAITVDSPPLFQEMGKQKNSRRDRLPLARNEAGWSEGLTLGATHF